MPLTIVISGVTSGLGLELLKAFIEAGHIVIGCGRRKDRLRSISQAYPSAILSEVDTSNEADVIAWAGETRKYLTRTGIPQIDILINNAGASGAAATPTWQNTKAFASVINTNILGCVYVLAHFKNVLQFEKGSASTIINMSSGIGRGTLPGLSAYSTSKFGLEAMSKCMAMELRAAKLQAICVPLAPGLVGTEMNRAKGIPSAEEWAKVAAPYILGLHNAPQVEREKQNGCSLSVPGFYPEAYKKTWIIPDGTKLPPPKPKL
eukprot:TRINITY_DN31654_c0_g1_i1.p1 TRINITY_DN31654_c0_g1~~TRINITY_DN31654_c0_g1_i1.p1  ORF type:complete len:263 (-),score=12.14 TRINITY_DN31654_c0_g1_i1:18-806(-)